MLELSFLDGLNGVEYEQADQVKAHWITIECCAESQEDQIVGLVHIGDFSGATMSHVSLWRNPVEFMRLMKWGEQSTPLRHKAVHIYNTPTLLKYIIDAGKSVISSKMRERVQVIQHFCSIQTNLN